MTRTVIGEFWPLVVLILLVRQNANTLDKLNPDLSVILRIILVLLLVPAIISEAGQMFLMGKRYRIAEELFRLVLPYRKLLSLIPIPYLAQICLVDWGLLVHALMEQQKYSEAVALSQGAIKLAKKRFRENSIEVTGWFINQAAILHLKGDFSAAESVANQAMKILDGRDQNLSKTEVIQLSSMLNNLGVILSDAGQPEKANEMLMRSLDLKEKAFGKDDPQLEAAYGNQGYALLKSRNYIAAETCLKRALDMGDKKGKQSMLLRGNLWNNLGDALRGNNKLVEAEQALNEALRIRLSTLPKTHPYMAYSYNNFGKLYCDQNKFEEAVTQFEKALKLRESISATHPDVADTLKDYAHLLRKMGKTSEAEKFDKRAQDILGKKFDNSSSDKQKKSSGMLSTIFIRAMATVVIMLCMGPLFLFVLETSPPEKVPDGLSANKYYDLGVRYKWSGWITQSKDALNRAIKLDPSGKIGLRAARFLKTKLPLYPVSQEAEALNIKGYNERDKSEAKKIFEEGISKYPKFEWPYLNLATLYLQEDDITKAKEYCNETLAISPNNEEAWLALARIKRKEKDFAGADECIAKVIDLECDPDDKATPKKAKAWLGKFLKFFPQ